MARFLFRFGFCTPEQWDNNKEHGWDDESSEGFFIEASSREGALAWGCEVAESLTHYLFQASGWNRKIPSWKESGFAYWIEQNPEAVLTSDVLKAFPEVREGDMPAFPERNIVRARTAC